MDSQSALTVPVEQHEPAWKRAHRRSIIASIDGLIFFAICGVELAGIHREQVASETWHAWMTQNWPLSEESARTRVKFGEVMESKLTTSDLATFRELVDAEELTDADREFALQILAYVSPKLSSIKQMLADLGIIKLPEKVEIADKQPARPRAPRPPMPMFRRITRSFQKLPEPDRVAFVEENLAVLAPMVLARVSRVTTQTEEEAAVTPLPRRRHERHG